MRKILYLITQSELGGAQKNVLDLATALKYRYKIVAAAGSDGGGALNERLDSVNVKNFRLRWLRRAVNPLFDLLAIWEIGRLILKERPDIIHLHSSKAGLLGSLAARLFWPKAKIIYTSHGAAFSASFSASKKKIFLWVEKLTAPLKDKIICVSQNEKKIWLADQVAPAEKLTVVANGLDLEILSKILPADKAREELIALSAPLFKALAGQTDKIMLVGTIANFYPDKGLPYLIEAAAKVFQRTDKKIIFVVIGDGLERKLYEEAIAARNLNNKFVLAGAVADAIKYLKAFQLYVQPSLKEGFGYSVLEALAADLPIVASHVGGIPEMITNNINGFLLFPRDVDNLAKKILELINNPALGQKFAAASQQKIQDFSLAKMVAATEKIYLEN